jgi:hypothetical protein
LKEHINERHLKINIEGKATHTIFSAPAHANMHERMRHKDFPLTKKTHKRKGMKEGSEK